MDSAVVQARLHQVECFDFEGGRCGFGMLFEPRVEALAGTGFATGQSQMRMVGFRIGFDGDSRNEEIGRSSSYLKRVMSDRQVTRPANSEWKQVVLSPEPDWLQYKGLWGVKSILKDESGPPGPKWDRPDKLFAVYPRKRWDKSLEWLAELETRFMAKSNKKE